MNLPHDTEAEDGLLGCVLLDGAGAMAKVLEAKIVPECFFTPHRQNVWKSILWLHKRGLAIEAAVLASELKRTKKLGDIGGAATIAEISAKVPTTAQFELYLSRVRDLYVQRRLIETCEATLEMARDGKASVENYTQAIHDILAVKQSTETIKTLPQAADDTIAHALRVMDGKEIEEDRGYDWPWASWNQRFGSAKPGEMMILAARPGMGKSSAARQCALHWMQYGDVLLFSREMPIEQLPALFAQQISGVSWKHFRSGQTTMDKQREFMAALEEVKKFDRLHIFDRDRTLAQITARTRAYSQVATVKGIVIDYLQRFDPQQEKGETRDTALGRMSMAFKDLAIDLKIPVLVLAQVGRSMEREKRQPFLSDLRECLSVKDTFVFTPQGIVEPNGALSTISVDKHGQTIRTDSRYAPRDDAPEMVRLTLQTGREIVCTPKHPILTDSGWVEAAKLKDEAVACIRHVHSPLNTERYRFAKWIGWMLGNGSMSGKGVPSFICSCEAVRDAFLQMSEAMFGFVPKRHAHVCEAVYQYDLTKHSVRTPEGNPVKQWLIERELWGGQAHQKFIPDWFCQTADNASLAELVAGLWETDGCVISSPRPCLSYSTTSRKLAWQVIWALHRLGIVARIEPPHMSEKANFPLYKVAISQEAEIALFRNQIPLIGRKGKKLTAFSLKRGNTSGSRLSADKSGLINVGRALVGLSHAQLGYRCQGKRISVEDCGKALDKLSEHGWESPMLRHLLAHTNIYWDRVRRITKEPGCPVFDRVVPEHHNFVANGIVVHNSGNLEQDADRVMFLWAPETKPDGTSQDPYDGSVSELYVEAVQAKGRGEGQDRTGMHFQRNVTTFRDIHTHPTHKENML